MNLHAAVRGAITAINQDSTAVLRISAGYTTANDGARTPTYKPDVPVRVQLQDLSQRDILHLDSLNVQGSQKVMYLTGSLSGLVRAKNKGNDLVILDGDTWAVSAVLEQWPDWARVAVTLQDGG